MRLESLFVLAVMMNFQFLSGDESPSPDSDRY